jgi:hypothetical protein
LAKFVRLIDWLVVSLEEDCSLPTPAMVGNAKIQMRYDGGTAPRAGCVGRYLSVEDDPRP